MEKRNVKWHKMTAQSAVEQLQTNATCGLSRKVASSRYRKLGANTLFDINKYGYWSVWKSVLRDPSILLLLFAVFLSFFFSFGSGIMIAVAIAVCAFALAFRLTGKLFLVNETFALYRIPTVFVLRDGKVFEISARQVVSGDILLLQKGDVIPCDCRLLESDGDVLTRFYFRDGSGKQAVLEQLKYAECVYPYESTVSAPHCENILYAKSELMQGNARALAVETGKYTYVGATSTSSTPRDRHSEDPVRRMMPDLLPYIRVYSVVLFLFILPFTVLGLLFAPDTYGIMRIFLPICLLSGIGAQSILLLAFRVIYADGYVQCIKTDSEMQKRAIPKGIGTLEGLTEITDLIVLGKCAASDGILHLHRAALGNGEISLIGGAQPSLAPVCEAYELLYGASYTAITSDKTSNSRLMDIENPNLRHELQKISQFDRGALHIKLKSATVREHKDGMILDVQMRDGEAQYCFTDQISYLYACTGYEFCQTIYPLEPDQKENLYRFINAAISEAGSPVIITKQVNKRMILVGILSCREEVQPFLPSVLEELKQSGIRVSFFLPNDTEWEQLYIKAAKLPASVLRSSRLQNELDFSEYYEKYRVFCGFSEKQIRMTLQSLKKRGHRFAVLGNDFKADWIQSEAELRIACDPLLQDQKKSNGELMISTPKEHHFISTQYNRSLSAHAHLLLPHATKKGGGLASFLNALSAAHAMRCRMRICLRYLGIAQLLRVACVAFSAVCGVGLLSGAQLIYCGFFADVIALYWILHIDIPQNRLRQSEALDSSMRKKRIFSMRIGLPAIATGLLLGIYSFFLNRVQVFSPEESVSFLFVSLLITQTFVLYKTIYTNGIKWDWRSGLLPAACILVPILLLIIIAFVNPALAALFEVIAPSAVGATSWLIGPLLYLGIEQIFSLTEKK